MNKKTKIYIISLVSISVLTFFLYAQFSKAGYFAPKIISSNGITSDVALRVYYFDVGQGDSIFIKTPEGKDILIDGGPDATVLERLGDVLPYWDHKIDWMVLTHPHADHIEGLDDVLKNYNVSEVLETDLKNITPEEKYFNQLAGNDNSKIEKAIRGEKINLENDLDMQILYPFNLQMDEKDLNDDSVVIKMTYKGKSFLFDGDATSNVETKLINAGVDLKADFLKVGHHGSRYASSTDFLKKVQPIVSIISVGAGNSFGHPTKDTLNRLASVGTKILRTDLSGTVEVDVGTDGSWQINCGKTCN